MGRSNVEVTRLGLASSYGVGASDVERAFERGVDLFYWGSNRTEAFGAGLARVAAKHRDRVRVVVQSYTRAGFLMRGSLERALRQLGIEHVDFLLLGWWNAPPPARIVDAALALRDAGLAKHLMISSHHRPTFEKLAANDAFAAVMVRYNAAHPGAEADVFPKLGPRPPGVVAYTATRWGGLLDPAKMPQGELPPRASDCYRFALTNPAVDAVWAGPADGAQLDEALETLERGPLSAQEEARIKTIGAHVRSNAAVPRAQRVLGFVDSLFG